MARRGARIFGDSSRLLYSLVELNHRLGLPEGVLLAERGEPLLHVPSCGICGRGGEKSKLADQSDTSAARL